MRTDPCAGDQELVTLSPTFHVAFVTRRGKLFVLNATYFKNSRCYKIKDSSRATQPVRKLRGKRRKVGDFGESEGGVRCRKLV